MEETIHDYETRMMSALNTLKNDDSIPEEDKDIIFRFKENCIANGLSKARALKYIYLLKRLRDWLDMDFERATKEDIKNLVIKIETSTYSDHTKLELKASIKRLYRLIRETDYYPPEVRWIKVGHLKIQRRKLPEELLTEEDIVKLINAANNPRDRAFVAMLYETGCRIGEILFVRIKHVQFDKYGAVVVVSGKTGSRRLRLVTSVPYITEWLNHHKQRDDPDAYLWPSKGNSVLRYQSVRKMMTRIGRRANIKKKLNPHNFRHSRATHLANYLTEAQMKEYFGWIRSSDMAEIYVHLCGRDIDNAILKVHGITNDNDEEESKLKPKNCSRCDMQNQATNNFCSRCGLPLNRETMARLTIQDLDRKESDRIMEELIKDDEFREIFLKKGRKIMNRHHS